MSRELIFPEVYAPSVKGAYQGFRYIQLLSNRHVVLSEFSGAKGIKGSHDILEKIGNAYVVEGSIRFKRFMGAVEKVNVVVSAGEYAIGGGKDWPLEGKITYEIVSEGGCRWYCFEHTLGYDKTITHEVYSGPATIALPAGVECLAAFCSVETSIGNGTFSFYTDEGEVISLRNSGLVWVARVA